MTLGFREDEIIYPSVDGDAIVYYSGQGAFVIWVTKDGKIYYENATVVIPILSTIPEIRKDGVIEKYLTNVYPS